MTAAGLCVMSLFFDGAGWLLALGGIVLLRRAAFSGSTKWLLAATAIAPKILFVGLRSLNTPEGLSFPIEPSNLATSSSLWVWCILLAAFGVYLLSPWRKPEETPNAPVLTSPERSPLITGVGLALIGAAAAVLLGLTEGFHRIDDAGQGRWALRHAARGNVAIFTGSELASIEAAERNRSRGGRGYAVRVALTDGRSFSVTTNSAAALDELRKFATTANLAKGKVRIVRRNGLWTSGGSGFTLKDCVGSYEPVDEGESSRSTFEFWLDGDRLTGKETVAGPEGRHVRLLRNIKVSDNGDMEFQPTAYVEATQRETGGAMSFSFRWPSQGETGRFVKNGFEAGLQKYRKK